jgi:peroxiredoxin
MALTESRMMNLGTLAPDFALLDVVSDQLINLYQVKGSIGTLLMFICNHCPYVIHVNPELIKITEEYSKKGISVLAISSNDIETYPQDGPEEMKIHAQNTGYNFPYLFDETQDVAKNYDAACTPDFYLFNHDLRLVYRGRLDDSRPRVENPKPLTGSDLRGALNALVADQMISEIQYPSMGCNIKWKTQ